VNPILHTPIRENEPIPRFGYGYAYSDYVRFVDIYCPIPLNLLVRLWNGLRWRYFRFAVSRWPVRSMNRFMQRVHRTGYDKGYFEAHTTARQKVWPIIEELEAQAFNMEMTIGKESPSVVWMSAQIKKLKEAVR